MPLIGRSGYIKRLNPGQPALLTFSQTLVKIKIKFNLIKGDRKEGSKSWIIMLAIKLSRIGKKNHPHYRVIITEKGRDPFGESLEILGDYNPHTKALQIKGERVQYWISKGAQMTPTVNNLLIEKGIVAGEKVKASKNPKIAEEKQAAEAKKSEAAKEGLNNEVKAESEEGPAKAADEAAENKEVEK